MMSVAKIIEAVLFVMAAIPVFYMLVFAIASRFRRGRGACTGESGMAETGTHIILIPAYRCDNVIFKTVECAVAQDYPSEKFRVVVIADGLRAETLERIEALDAEVIEVKFENSSKARSLQYAMHVLGASASAFVSVLDADNLVGRDYLSGLDAAFRAGAEAVQAHRTARNRDTSTAVIDAASEEINNSIYRSGHRALGLSSALIGSGMTFRYGWFYDNIDRCVTSGEDKELELLLLSQGVQVEYCEDILVLDEKTSSSSGYYNQRRRWIASQYYSLETAFRMLPKVNSRGLASYLDKMLQWCFLPRMILMALPVFMVLVLLIMGSALAWRWMALILFMALSLFLALPPEHADRKLLHAMLGVPKLVLLTFLNMFRLRGTKTNFVHTEHRMEQ